MYTHTVNCCYLTTLGVWLLRCVSDYINPWLAMALVAAIWAAANYCVQKDVEACTS